MASTMTTKELKTPSAPSSMAQTIGDAAGLTEAEAERRLAQYGENALVEHHDRASSNGSRASSGDPSRG